MNTCRCTGSTAFTRSPRPELSTGMSRQPISVWPFGGDRLLDDLLDFGARRGVARHEELADARNGRARAA